MRSAAWSGANRCNDLIDPMKSTRRHLTVATIFLSLTVSAVAQVSSVQGKRTGADIYRDFCAVCHSGGWQGAPVANDASEWNGRVDAGADVMFKNVKEGLNGMPPMGTCTDCTDEELKKAITEMLPKGYRPLAVRENSTSRQFIFTDCHYTVCKG
jgi:cytochrome c5